VAVVITGLWIASIIRGEDKLNKEIAGYSMNQQDFVTDNAMIAIIGLVAPPNVEDTYAWALSLIRKHMEESEKWIKDIKNAPDKVQKWEMIQKNLDKSLIDKVDTIPNKIEWQGNTDGLRYWVEQEWGSDCKKCPSEKEVLKLADSNRILLKRYRDLTLHKQFIQPPDTAAINMELLIRLHELHLAQLIIQSKTNPDASLKEWLQNNAFVKAALMDKSSLVTKSVLMVMYSQSLHALPNILRSHQEFAAKYEKPLLNVLGPFGPKDYNIHSAMKYEYTLVSPVIEQLGTYSQNKYFFFLKDFEALATYSASQFQEQNTRFQKTYDYNQYRMIDWQDWHHPISATTTNFLIKGASSGSDLLGAMHTRDATSRMLSLYIQALSSSIPEEKMADFMTKSPPDLYDPFTQKPFRWNQTTGTLYFINPAHPDAKVSLRVY